LRTASQSINEKPITSEAPIGSNDFCGIDFATAIELSPMLFGSVIYNS